MSSNYYKDIEHPIEMRKRNDRRDYHALLNAGLTAQEEKLRENQHKESFDDVKMWDAYTMLRDEVEELDCEIDSIDKDFSKIRREAADIANFCHMIILRCDQEMKNEK